MKDAYHTRLSYQEQIAAIMLRLGTTALVPAEEETENSVWVTEDDAPEGRAGYYVKRQLPLEHKLTTEGIEATLHFHRSGAQYFIRCQFESTSQSNLRAVVYVLGTVLTWIHHNIVSWDEGFSPFLVRESEWWRVLRAPPDATPQEIKEAYDRALLKTHPDHGGSIEAFLAVQRAYDEIR